MEKRIAELTTDPHTVSLTDRKCSLFIDPQTGSIFVDEGDGEGRMNGVVFSVTNRPSFSARTGDGARQHLVLNYCGAQYELGEVSEDSNALQSWISSANAFLRAKHKQPVIGKSSVIRKRVDLSQEARQLAKHNAREFHWRNLNHGATIQVEYSVAI